MCNGFAMSVTALTAILNPADVYGFYFCAKVYRSDVDHGTSLIFLFQFIEKFSLSTFFMCYFQQIILLRILI